jgi:hypothetical protein
LEEYTMSSVSASVSASVLASVLALDLYITLCAPADAATLHHPKRRHVVVRANEGVNFDGLNFGPAVSSWAYARARPPMRYEATPSYNDPSKFGGQSLGTDP